jgi:hypothetical protein
MLLWKAYVKAVPPFRRTRDNPAARCAKKEGNRVDSRSGA